jgi:predicted PurR-regulated permease PerM
VALIQALAVGLILLVAGVPLAGLLAIVVLVLGVALPPCSSSCRWFSTSGWAATTALGRRSSIRRCC